MALQLWNSLGGRLTTTKMQLRKSTRPGEFLLSLQGRYLGGYELNVETCPVAYSAASGWKGKTRQVIDGKDTIIVCEIGREKEPARWSISVVPKTEKSLPVEQISTPRLIVNLSRDSTPHGRIEIVAPAASK